VSSPANRTYDLTSGSLSAHFRRLAVPAAIGMVFNTLYNVVDTFYAGRISTEAQAAMAIAFQAFFLLNAVGFGLAAAMGALVGNAAGQRDGEGARRFAAQGLGYAALACVVLWGVGSVVGPALIRLISAPGGYREAAFLYFGVQMLALPGFVVGFAANGILRAQGDTVSQQRALIVAFFANIGLNPLFIYGVPGLVPALGLNGIAVATAVSQTGVMAYLLFRVNRTEVGRALRLPELRPRINPYRQITAQALPTAFTMLVLFVTGFVVQYYLKNFGDAAVAAYGVALRVEQLFLLPVFGLTTALLPITAQNFGAGEPDRVRSALFTCWKYGWIFMAVACPILWVAGRPILSLFTNDPEVLRIGASYLRVDGVILPAYMMLFAINAFLQGLKKPVWSLWIGLYRQAFAVAFFAWVFVQGFGLGIWGVWFGIATAVVTGLLLALFVTHRVATRLLGGFWRPPAPPRMAEAGGQG